MPATLLKIASARHAFLDTQGNALPEGATAGYPVLELRFDDGRVAAVAVEDCKFLGYGHDLVHLGGQEFEDDLPPIDLPADPGRGLDAQRLRGFTADAAVVRLARRFLGQVRDDTFAPGRVGA